MGRSASRQALGLAGASLWERGTFSWVAPRINKGFHQAFEEQDAAYLVPESDDVPALSQRFERCYAQVKVSGPGSSWPAASAGSQRCEAGRSAAQPALAASARAIAAARTSSQARLAGQPAPRLNITTRTLLRLYSATFAVHAFWVLCEVAIR